MSSGMAGSGSNYFDTLRYPSHPIPGAYTASLHLVALAGPVEGQPLQFGLLSATGSLGWSELVAVGYRRVAASVKCVGHSLVVESPIVFGPDVLAWSRPVGLAMFDARRGLVAAGEFQLLTARPGTGTMAFEIGQVRFADRLDGGRHE